MCNRPKHGDLKPISFLRFVLLTWRAPRTDHIKIILWNHAGLPNGLETPKTKIPQTTKTIMQRAAQPAIARFECKADSTLRSSRAVPHPSTNRALRRLTSEVRRDPVHSTRYGRRRPLVIFQIRPYHAKLLQYYRRTALATLPETLRPSSAEKCPEKF